MEILSNFILLAVPDLHPCVAFLSSAAPRPKTKSPKYPKQLDTLGDHIRKRRLDLGMFQRQVAEQIGVDEDTIFRWESNESRPQIQFIPAIIEFLSYNPLQLPDSPSKRLIFYREVLGLSQRKLANRTGIDPKAIELAETGKRPLSKKLRKVIESF